MCIKCGIEAYTNRTDLQMGLDYGLQEDCNTGLFLKFWNIEGITPPTTQQILTWRELGECLCCLLEEAKEVKLIQNEINYLGRRNGIKVITGVPINIDPTSCVNISGKLLQVMVNKINGGLPLTITWYCDDNLAHVYTEEEFINIGNIVAYTVEQIQFKLSDNIIAINNALSIEAVEAIDIDFTSF